MNTNAKLFKADFKSPELVTSDADSLNTRMKELKGSKSWIKFHSRKLPELRIIKAMKTKTSLKLTVLSTDTMADTYTCTHTIENESAMANFNLNLQT